MDTRTCRDAMVRPMRILVTTTSFQDTPGAHHDVLAASEFDIVHTRGSGVTWREATRYINPYGNYSFDVERIDAGQPRLLRGPGPGGRDPVVRLALADVPMHIR